MGTTIIGRCDCSETFLSSGIPLIRLVRTMYVWGMIPFPKKRTIWSFTVLPSNSIVRIFWFHSVRRTYSSNSKGERNERSRRQWWRCSSPYKCHRQNAVGDKTFQHPSLRWGGAWRDSRIYTIVSLCPSFKNPFICNLRWRVLCVRKILVSWWQRQYQGLE